MSSASLPHQHISGTSAIDNSIALAGHFPTLTNVAIGPRESSRPPEPSSTVPFRRDPDFVNRGDILCRVDEKCSRPAGRAALVGLGGAGKSQLAIEYTHRTRERSPDTWVFWVHASNAARFEQGYRDIAATIKIPGREDPKADIFKIVHDCLRGCGGKWLMVLDNVDDADFLLHTHAVIQCHSSDSSRQTLRPLRDYIPQSQNGSILITTRSRESALKLSEWSDLIPVNPMNASNAVELLDKKLESIGQWNDKDHVELAAALEFMPLAIVQAASYISKPSPRYSVRQYIENLQKSDRKKTSLLNYEGGQLRRDWEAQNSIIITWQISFEHIRRIRPSAANLLSLMSFFDRQGIPEALVRNRAASDSGHESLEEADKRKGGDGKEEEEEEDDKASASVCSEDDGFEEDLLMLRDYSFLSVGTDGTFEMHALVQLATRKWLEAHGQLEAWKQCYIKNLSAQFPTGEYENWTYCQALYPHVKSAVTQQPKGEGSLREWASLLHNAAWYALRKGSIIEAVDLSKIAMKIRKKKLGQEHKETLASMGMLSLAYNHGGRWREAEELEMRVIVIRKRVLGEKHPDTLTSMNNLALIYDGQGRWKEAEELYVRVIARRKRVLGEEHPDTLTSINNLASIYDDQGRWKKAEELYVRVLAISKRVLGEEHPDTLTTINNLALVYRHEGLWKEAEELHMRGMAIRTRVLGEEHPDTLAGINNLALIYDAQGRWKEAEELAVRVIGLGKRVLGEEHPGTLTSMNNLAFTWEAQGQKAKAINLMGECLHAETRILGADHPYVKTSSAALIEWQKEESENRGRK